MKKRLLIAAAFVTLAAVIGLLILVRIQPDMPEGVDAYVSGSTELYRTPDSPEPFATIPAGTHVRWISTTADYAFGEVVAEVNGKSVRAYAPWLALNIASDNTESDQAMEYLRTEVGWSEEEIGEYQMHAPARYMRGQFVNVEVRSKTHPQFVYYIWLDKLNGGLHDIQSPFSGTLHNAEEKEIRERLRQGDFASAEEVGLYFFTCYGPQEGWSPALKEWISIEMGKYPQ